MSQRHGHLLLHWDICCEQATSCGAAQACHHDYTGSRVGSTLFRRQAGEHDLETRGQSWNDHKNAFGGCAFSSHRPVVVKPHNHARQRTPAQEVHGETASPQLIASLLPARLAAPRSSPTKAIYVQADNTERK